MKKKLIIFILALSTMLFTACGNLDKSINETGKVAESEVADKGKEDNKTEEKEKETGSDEDTDSGKVTEDDKKGSENENEKDKPNENEGVKPEDEEDNKDPENVQKPEDEENGQGSKEDDGVRLVKGDKLVAFTFDDGPGAYTDELLDAFKQYDGRATFFLIGQNVGQFPKVVQREIDEGHLVGNHSFSHPSLDRVSDERVREEINKTNDAIAKAANGYKPKLVRPPYGNTNNRVQKIFQEMGMSAIHWSVDTRDWESKNADAVYKMIMKYAEDGAIILQHDIHKTTIEGVKRALADLHKQGFKFVTVEELLKAKGTELVPGYLYFNAKDFKKY